MKLIKALFSRLSESLLSNDPGKLSPATEFSPASPLRLVSDKPTVLPSLDSSTRRPVGHAVSQPDAIDDAIKRSQAWFLNQQQAEGYWVAELEADTTLTSEYLMLRRFLDRVDPDREEKAVRYVKAMQLPDGGWPIYYGGPAEISASVKAYFALKLSGVTADEPFMLRAKERILAMGGVVQANVFTKITLALFDQYDWEGVPHMPVEIMLLPKRFYFSIYAISYWSRAVLIPLLIVFAHRPVCKIPREQGIEELYPMPRGEIRYWKFPPFNKDQQWFTPHNFFVALDAMLKLYDRMPLRMLREKALQKAATWMLEHLKGSGGLGAIYPAMANSIMALQCLGYDADDPLVVKALREIEELEVYDSVSLDGRRVSAVHLQPCFSPIWDTALLMNALIEAGLPQDHPALQKAGAYLLSTQTKTVGDWIISSPKAEPGGWYFQFENELYPDIDDSAVVLMALSKLKMPQEAGLQESIRRGMQWVVAMQGSDGGWGAYDKDNNRIVFNYIPFADHHALLDPSTSDLAGRCLEMLGALGYDSTHSAAAPALAFLKKEQEQDGSWYGRWGVNYIYGTWSVLAGLRAIGEDLSAPHIRKAVSWLESKQNPDGGWGESCVSYGEAAHSGKGESTPSQTAWAVMALMSAGVTDSFSVARGAQFLLRRQMKDGSWEEVRHTGTGFPGVFYLRYHWYCQYFPLWALAMYRNLRSRGKMRADEVRHQIQGAGSYRIER
ncbi:MAG: squalene-hopene cyclase [Nitrospira sp.]|nr:MAG: squalene-hopene cyclase [Nitrospira sp.]